MIFAIGDIHGRADMLKPALAELQTNLGAEDTVVFLGDYIDRGEDSRGVIDAAIAFRAIHPNTIFLRGNHEQMLLDAYEDAEAIPLWLVNGGTETLNSYGTYFFGCPLPGSWKTCIPESHMEFLRSTLLEWEDERFHFVHAGLVPPSQDGMWGNFESTAQPDARLWIRKEFIESQEDFGKIVVFGHTMQKTFLPLIMPNKMGLDTAAVFDGRLTVGIFDDQTTDYWYFQVNQQGEVRAGS